ncbi:aromatic amino acid transport family protein [Shewanella sp. GXUN23E]|uniref:aromatic amino acid transport family protein n=1 Tax=Shewanella sp. GXUN23E TaxID=3422498 RepID=UPI003D7DDCDD
MTSIKTLFAGTSIICTTALGSGLFVIPIVLSNQSLWVAGSILAGYCTVMTIAALVMVEISLRFPKGSNIHSIAREGLGNRGALISGLAFCIVFTFVLYSSLCGLIELVGYLSEHRFNKTIAWILLICFLSFLVMAIGQLDKLGYINAVLWIMVFSLTIFSLFNIQEINYPASSAFQSDSIGKWLIIIPLCQSCFSFHAILPSMVKFFNQDRKTSIASILITMPIVYLIYMVWLFSVREALPASLISEIASNAQSTQELISSMADLLSPFFSAVMYLLYFVVIFTSLVGLSMAAQDFVKDKLSLNESIQSNLISLITIYTVPVLLYFYNDDGFIYGIQISVLGSTFLAILLPTIIAIKSRAAGGHEIEMINGRFLKFLLVFGVLSLLINVMSQVPALQDKKIAIPVNTCIQLLSVNSEHKDLTGTCKD